MDHSEKYERYRRQILLREFGEESQDKLFAARILVVGAGGLGCPALQYLAAAGTGTIGVIDFDIVELSNLQRQILYTVDDLGEYKVNAVRQKLKAMNPMLEIKTYNSRLDTKNALSIISDYDLVIDGSDNFSTRYLINDACVLLNKPFVYGAVLRFEGQVAVFNLLDSSTGLKINYRDLFPEPPDPSSTMSCNEVGVLGVLPGLIGTMQATEALKIITGIGKPLCNKLISYNALTNTFFEFSISINEKSKELVPTDESKFLNYDYDWFCSASSAIHEVSVLKFDEIRTMDDISIIDVREENELPAVDEFTCRKIPLREFEAVASDLPIEREILIFCQSGIRSLIAVKLLREKHPGCRAYSLTGGILAWKKHHMQTTLK
jgi:adenylyltransferase/sulfurtransferase